MKCIVALFLLMTVAAIAFAAGNGGEVASIDPDLSLSKTSRVASPVVTEKYEYYEIRGCCEKDLHCQLCQKNCKWNDGRKYDSSTSWHVTWDYDYVRTPQSCSAGPFRTAVEIKFRYPKWMPAAAAPQELVEKWDGYLKSLMRHENGHRDLVVEAAAELSRAVAELPPAPTCADLDREVHALCRARMEKLNTDQKAYDARTNYGVTQGAVFP